MEENWLSEEDVSAQVDPLYEEIKTVKKNAMKQVHKLNKQIKELKEEITCLESDSMNEVSQVEFDEMVEEKDEEIKELKLKLQASREVSTCYAKVVSQSPERKVEEILKRLVISPESAKKVASMIPDEKINLHH
jgi:septal ring factor EnvC (AmiA/AmiB activator)